MTCRWIDFRLYDVVSREDGSITLTRVTDRRPSDTALPPLSTIPEELPPRVPWWEAAKENA